MRYLNLRDDKQRDAKICFEPLYSAAKVDIPEEYNNCRILKETNESCAEYLLRKNKEEGMELGNRLLKSDEDVDIESAGKFIESTSRIFVDKENKPVFNVTFEEQILSPEEKVIEQHQYIENESNIQNETLPLSCTGLTISKKEAARRYVFTKHYKLRHVNGLTFEFLSDIAKKLEAEKVLMFAGAGKDGTEPIVLQKGGKKYRGFLEGRTTEDGYLLLLHLTEINLEDFDND